MYPGYPISFEEITEWARTHQVPEPEARIRFIQYAILRGIAGSRSLRESLVLKGGNALDFMWQPNRSTTDLDFSVDPHKPLDHNTEIIKNQLTSALSASGRQLNVTLIVHRVRQQPPGEGRTFITYQVKVGYALPDEEDLIERIRESGLSTQTISLDISINEEICATVDKEIDPSHRVRASTPEDIIAEKLRALLQQAPSLRNRTRPQDLLDIAVYLRRQGTTLDRTNVATFLQRKAEARGVPISHKAFLNPEIKDRAGQDYNTLQSTTRTEFIPFEEAWEILQGFVNELKIPSNYPLI